MSKNSVKIIIPGTLPGLNEYDKAERGNRYQAAKMKKETEEYITLIIKQQAKGVQFFEPVNIEYTWYEPNMKRDKDNVAFAKKFVQDSLVAADVIKNDGWKEIDGFSDRFAIDKKNPRVEILIKKKEDDYY